MNDIRVMLLYVLESKGSSPGRQGFCMAVNEKQQMAGSIGGGIMEHKFVELAKDRLEKIKNKGDDSLNENEIRKQVHDKSATNNQSGMICSGEQTLVIIELKKKDIDAVAKINKCIDQHKNGCLRLSAEEFSFSEIIPDKNFEFIFSDENQWTYIEKIGYKNFLFVVGGGHCSLAFCRLMSTMDFYITLYDDRKGLNTLMANEYAQEVELVTDYAELEHHIPSGENNYVVVMTFGYRTDDIAVRSLINKSFKYFGLLGSKKKIEKMFENYRNEGINESCLKNIHSPIGLAIQSETPEEIAISIAAEIIQVKNKKR